MMHAAAVDQGLPSRWRSPYLLASAGALASGTRLVMTTYFDTSEKARRRARDRPSV